MCFTLQLTLETCLYAYIKKKYYVCSLCGYVTYSPSDTSYCSDIIIE